jgi:hypothetical protein
MLMMSAGVQASTQDSGVITGFITLPNNAGTGMRFLFYTDGARSARPGCDCCNRWEIDSTTPIGQSWAALLLTAYGMHKTIKVIGTGTCVSGSNDTEGVSQISTDGL